MLVHSNLIKAARTCNQRAAKPDPCGRLSPCHLNWPSSPPSASSWADTPSSGRVSLDSTDVQARIAFAYIHQRRPRALFWFTSTCRDSSSASRGPPCITTRCARSLRVAPGSAWDSNLRARSAGLRPWLQSGQLPEQQVGKHASAQAARWLGMWLLEGAASEGGAYCPAVLPAPLLKSKQHYPRGDVAFDDSDPGLSALAGAAPRRGGHAVTSTPARPSQRSWTESWI